MLFNNITDVCSVMAKAAIVDYSIDFGSDCCDFKKNMVEQIGRLVQELVIGNWESGLPAA